MSDGYVSANAAAKGAPPQWDEAGRVHDWRNHVPADVRRIWHTFSREQLAVITAWAEDLAMDEEWE